MQHNGYQNYLEDEILRAAPLELVQLMYRGALDRIAAARQCLRSGDIRARSQSLTKAFAIVHELSSSLNHTKGGELSKQLAALYDYVERLLLDANATQTEPPLIEAERLLSTLLDAWASPAHPTNPVPHMQESTSGCSDLSFAC